MRVLCDLDGVLYDWTSIYLKLYQEFSGEELPLDFRWGWHFMRQLPSAKAKSAITKSSRLWTEGLPFPGALDGLRTLCSAHDTYIATQPGPRPDIAVPGKVQWLAHFAPWFDIERLICIKPKHLLQADALIDDRPTNLLSWKETNPRGIPLLIARPWNMGDRLNLAAFGTSMIPGITERIGARVMRNLGEAAEVLGGVCPHCLEPRERVAP